MQLYCKVLDTTLSYVSAAPRHISVLLWTQMMW